MRRGFTLIELLVVVVVIVTLMAVTFRLGSAGSNSTARARTINRMQRLENCLSGYYAAYGSYPPVGLHGSRDYTLEVNGQGIQQVDSGDQWSGRLSENWDAVEAACRSQPVGMSYPFADNGIAQYVKDVSDILMERANTPGASYKEAIKHGFFALSDNREIGSKSSYSDWSKVQVFKLGLMSYLLPRLLVIFDVKSDGSVRVGSGFIQLLEQQSQWGKNNEVPSDFETGQQYKDWQAVLDVIEDDKEPWKIAALPSQAVCARWMPNLEGIVYGSARTYYGVAIHDTDSGATVAGGVSATQPPAVLYSLGDSQSGGNSYSQQYILDSKTVNDGWGNEFYYYSPTPHQSYTLWSAGPNGVTFPPWVTDEEIAAMEREDGKTAQQWMADDIVHMQN